MFVFNCIVIFVSGKYVLKIVDSYLLLVINMC